MVHLTRARGCSALGKRENIGTGRQQLRSKESCSKGVQTLLGPMAEEAPGEKGLRISAATQDASVSDGESPRSWWVRGNWTFLSFLRNILS